MSLEMDKSEQAAAIFDKYAGQYEGKYMDVSSYSQNLDLFCRVVEKENAEILELACGPGNATNYLFKQRPDFKILGTDLSPRMIELAKKNNPRVEFRLLDCRKAKSLGKKFDGVVAAFCLPYLSKKEALLLIRDIESILRAGGVIYLSTMEADYANSGFEGPEGGGGDKLFMHYHEAAYLREALEKNGFEILELSRGKRMTAGKVSFCDLMIIAKGN